jgi:hypothetical protein
MVKVTVPNVEFSGERFGVPFHKGQAIVGTLSETQRERFAELGYPVEDLAPIAPEETSETGMEGGEKGMKETAKGGGK